MPAAAVIRRGQALSGIIGRKEYVGGYLSTRYILGVAEFRLIPVGDWKIDSNGK